MLKVVTPPMFQSVGQSNGTLTFTWSATEEDKYQLQCNSDLGSTNWINLGSILIATNSAVTASEIVGSEPQRFYRVVLLP